MLLDDQQNIQLLQFTVYNYKIIFLYYINTISVICIMNQILGLFLFTLVYYQLNNMLKPCVYNKFEVFKEEPIIFSPLLYSANVFILYIFVMLNINLIFFSRIKKGSLFTLSLIYFKYVLDNVIEFNTIGLYQYEFRRTIM